MRNRKSSAGKTGSILIMITVLFIFALAGCGTTGSDSAGSGSWGDTTASTTTSTYAVSGRIISPVSLSPVVGMNCTLQATSGTRAVGNSVSTTTDNNGYYSFSGVSSGNYRLVTTKDGHITDNSYFNVASNKTIDLTSVRKDEWNTVMGANYPYDSSLAYVSAFVDHTGAGTPQVTKEPGKAGIAVDLFSNSKGSGYQARCYYDSNGKPDWSGTATSNIGVAMFYKVVPDNTYTIKATKENHTFDDISNVAPIKGEFTNYMLSGKSKDSKVLSGLCFGPYLTGSNNQYVDRAKLERLIQTIAPYTGGVRTYTVSYGLDKVPEIAKACNPPLNVAACAFLNSGCNNIDPGKIPELRKLIDLVRERNVDIALVGNEATLQGVTMQKLKDCIRYAKDQLKGVTTKSGTPVKVASGLCWNEVQDAELRSLFKDDNGKDDLLFLHTYPCYSDPDGCDGTEADIKRILNWVYYDFLRGQCQWTGDIIFGEIGWATAGGQLPGKYKTQFNETNAATHLRVFKDWADEKSLPYYYFAAYDEDWKAQEHPDRPFESHFGIWDNKGALKDCLKPIIDP